MAGRLDTRKKVASETPDYLPEKGKKRRQCITCSSLPSNVPCGPSKLDRFHACMARAAILAYCYFSLFVHRSHPSA